MNTVESVDMKELDRPENGAELSFSQLSDNIAKVAKSVSTVLSADARCQVLQEQTFINFALDENETPQAFEDDGVALFITDLEFFAEMNFYADGRISLMKYTHGNNSCPGSVDYNELGSLSLREIVRKTKQVLYTV